MPYCLLTAPGFVPTPPFSTHNRFMESVLSFFIIIPLIGFIISLIFPRRFETAISRTAFLTSGVQLLVAIVFSLYWLLHGHPQLNVNDGTLYQTTGYRFFIDVSFDNITAVYLLVGSFLTFLVTIYSRYYMHREAGYKRFFNSIHFFYLGYVITICSGNFETLFIGWEMLGISSFLLIAFYRDRYLPVKNAVKVFSVYRIGDVGIILAMWMSHHLWHENITFSKLNNYELVHHQLQSHSAIGIFISLMLLVAALAKSAQLPFSSWLPRAMEGPTPSSAIFYGSLSVHIGAFLLLRTFPLWEHQTSVRVLIVASGLLTSIITTGIARVQSSVKSQIAYASIAQIGLIFVEIALGFEVLALVHFAGNAFLRTYQLLISPSIVTYRIRDQFYHFSPEHKTIESTYPTRLSYTFYVLSLKEWNLDSMMYRLFWNPLKWAGRRLDFLTVKRVLPGFIPVYLFGILGLYNQSVIPATIVHCLPSALSFIGLLMALKAFTERKKAIMSWTLVIMNHLWIILSISFNEHVTGSQIGYYLSGVVVAGLAGILCLYQLKRMEHTITLKRFHGYAHLYPRLALFFLLCCLGLSGFPITPTFIGEDLIFTHIHSTQPFLAFCVAMSIVVDGLAIIRIYARVFLGPDVKSAYGSAYRAS
jgi:NADH-quinone oxidoreductase subunit L